MRKAILLALIIQTFCVNVMLAQKVSLFNDSSTLVSRSFWVDWRKYETSKPQLPIYFSTKLSENCAFDGFGFRNQPQFQCTCNNLDAAKTIGTQNLWLGGSLGLNLSGAGMNSLAVWDGGSARITHRELLGRVTIMDSPNPVSGHTTAIVGNLIATGINTNAKGTSYQALLKNWNFTNDNAEIIAAAPSLLLSNHSYTSICAWQNIGGSIYWYGDSSIHQFRDWKFGYYDNRSRIWDSVMFQNPYYLMVKAAGNDRNNGVAPGTSHYYWNGTAWVLTNTIRDTVGPYDCVSTFGNAKNLLSVGAVNAMPNGFPGNTAISTLSFSAWGPTDDGRIKPDIVGASGSILSTGTAHDSDYASIGGTSISTANITGSLLLLQEYFHLLKGRYMRNATLKALAIHSANRCKLAAGPDYECGWGLPDMRRAALCIKDSIKNTILEQSLNNNDSLSIDVYVTTGDSLRATLVWTDPKSNTATPAYNDTTPKLINDLDLRLCNLAGTNLAFPFKMNPASPAAPATTGDNRLDNVEQIYTTALNTGRYTLKVKHKGQLQNFSPQPFSLLISGSPLYSASLPVVWLNLHGHVLNSQQAKLEWTTVQEVNNLYFDIEYSFDGNNFKSAGKVNSKGGNQLGQTKYEFTHTISQGLPENIYYRIKQVDVDGKESNSKTIQLINENPFRINGIYPNPFTNFVTIDFICKNPSNLSLALFDMRGMLFLEKSVMVPGSQPYLLDFSNLSLLQGYYFLRITHDGINYMYKLVKN